MKIPAEFAPQSWEMPPGFRVLEESASVVTREFDGEKLDWLIVSVKVPTHSEPILWMRPLDTRFDAGFVICDFVHYNVDTRNADELSADFSELLPLFWEQNRLSRMIFFNDKGELRGPNEKQRETIIITPNGLAAWGMSVINKQEHRAAKFEWNAPLENIEFLRLSSLEVWKRIQNLLSDSSSEAQFARQFIFMNEVERLNALFAKSIGADQEIKSLMLDLLISQEIWDQVPEGEELELYSQPESHTGLWLKNIDEGFPMPESLKADLELMWNQFRVINKEFLSHECSQYWYEYDAPKFIVSSSRPTMHEQLEAQLRWREWKAKHEKL